MRHQQYAKNEIKSETAEGNDEWTQYHHKINTQNWETETTTENAQDNDGEIKAVQEWQIMTNMTLSYKEAELNERSLSKY